MSRDSSHQDRGSSPNQNESAGISFRTGRGKGIWVSNESLDKARSLMAEIEKDTEKLEFVRKTILDEVLVLGVCPNSGFNVDGKRTRTSDATEKAENDLPKKEAKSNKPESPVKTVHSGQT
eukprot:TRINITY_DN18030_c0_g1_i1.p1 TRINITY_DN18030_c0_g1~~TRINITY_DN18030_c0_g1_i1.p1  ORF type:complete len:121 (-),score=12.16 TRINITY_DN18030_c0_g1_i1:206-568(-)